MRKLVSLTLLLIGAAWSSLPGEETRPNILFIAVDDLRPELGSYGSRALTPNLDRLAESGLRFDRAYCNQAVCGASRLSLMTGLYPEFTKERTYHVSNWRQRWKNVITLNQHFGAHGYTTVGLGKIYHGTGGAGVDPGNWTRWIKNKGLQYANPESLKQGRPGRKKGPGGAQSRRGPSTESAQGAEETYSDGVRAREGARQLRQLSTAGKPFFLAVGFTKPHLPFNAPTKYWDLYRRESFRLPKNAGVPPGYPEFARNAAAGELRAYADIPRDKSPAQFPSELNKRLLHGYHACVSYMDRNVGVLLNALQESGAAENTIVIFWADHGWKLGDHSSWCKHTNFECDTRVPLIIRHPGKATTKGRTDALVELIDLYPTLCDLSGLPKPAHLQGKSFLPVLENPKSGHRDFAYSSYPHGGKGRKPVIGHSIRTAHHRYTEWWESGTDNVITHALTNLKDDPGETTSALPDKEDYAKTLSRKLRARVLEVRRKKSRRLD
jgi:iduronate 2-sulfatase